MDQRGIRLPLSFSSQTADAMLPVLLSLSLSLSGVWSWTAEQCFSHRRRDYPFKWSGYGSIGPNELLNITAKGEES